MQTESEPPETAAIIFLPSEMSILHFLFAQNLNFSKIVSPCFWHIWADKVIECSALQFSTLMQGAEYVFTTTFHGAVFTLLNHKRCCIYSQRAKVGELVESLGVEKHLLYDTATYEDFKSILSLDFPTEKFENQLIALRDYSQKALNSLLSQITE